MNDKGYFIKRPIEVFAYEWDGNWENVIKEFPDNLTWTKHGLNISTLEGVMSCEVGDYIVRGIENEIYSVKKSIFLNSYKKVK